MILVLPNCWVNSSAIFLDVFHCAARAALAVVECGHAMLSEDWESALPDKVRFKSNIAPQLECGIDGMANGQAVDKFSELQRQLCSLRNELFLEVSRQYDRHCCIDVVLFIVEHSVACAFNGS